MSVTKTVRRGQFQIALWPTENVFVAHWWAMALSLGTTGLTRAYFTMLLHIFVSSDGCDYAMLEITGSRITLY